MLETPTFTNLYRAIFDRVGDAIFVVDLSRDRFIDVNERARKTMLKFLAEHLNSER